MVKEIEALFAVLVTRHEGTGENTNLVLHASLEIDGALIIVHANLL